MRHVIKQLYKITLSLACDFQSKISCKKEIQKRKSITILLNELRVSKQKGTSTVYGGLCHEASEIDKFIQNLMKPNVQFSLLV